jgi:hypothetical protein
MKDKSLQRILLLASGICAVLVILVSQSFYSAPSLTKEKTEKAKDSKEVTIHAPSDVAAQGQAVELNQAQPGHVEELVLENDQNVKAVFVEKIATKFFKTLFRVFISPNAP